MSSDFFKRKEEKIIELPKEGEYDLSNFENDALACGINDIEGFQARHTELFSNLIVDSDQSNPVAIVTQKFESYFTKRELAFLISKDLLQAAYENSVESLKQK